MNKHSLKCRRRKKRRAVEYMGGECHICGYKKCYAALEFHHLDRKTKGKLTPTQLITQRSWEELIKELDKCILVCSNCHKEIHWGQVEIAELQKIKRQILTIVCEQCGCKFQTKDKKQKFCSQKCYNLKPKSKIKPTKAVLDKMLWEMPTTQIAKIYNITDKAVEKWAKNYKLSKPPRGYWQKKKSDLYGSCPALVQEPHCE